MADIKTKKIIKLNVDGVLNGGLTEGETGRLVNYISIENNDENLTANHLIQSQATLANKINEIIGENTRIEDVFESFYKNITDEIKGTYDDDADYAAAINPGTVQNLKIGDKYFVSTHKEKVDGVLDTDGKQLYKTYYGRLFIVGQAADGSKEMHVFYEGIPETAISDQINAVTGGSTLSIQKIKEEIDKEVKGTTASANDLTTATDATIKLLQFEIEEMNGVSTYGRLGQGVNGKPFTVVEKQDKLRDDQFIETADVQYLDLSAISSAAGISADLTTVKTEIQNLKNKDSSIDTELNTVKGDIAKLQTANPDIARIDGELTTTKADLTTLQNKEAADIVAVKKEIASKADTTTLNAITTRVGTVESKVTTLENNAGTQAATVTQHTTKIGSLETTTATHTGQITGLITTTGDHTNTIQKHTDQIKDIKSLASFMGIYVPATFPHTTTASEIKAAFGPAEIGMFVFAKATADGDKYEIWTAKTIVQGGNVVSDNHDWVHPVNADISINMKPYLEMEMVADGSRQKGPAEKGYVIYGDITDASNNKWVSLKKVIEDAFAIVDNPIVDPKRVDDMSGRVMTIVNKGTDAAPDYQLEFIAGQLTGTNELQDISGVWSDVQTPKEGDMVVVRKVTPSSATVPGVIVEVGGSTRKPVLGETEFDSVSVSYVPKTDGKDKLVIGGTDSTKLVYIDNPDFTTDKSRRIFAIDDGEGKGSWKPLKKAEINGKANFTDGDDEAKMMVVKSIDDTTGDVELEPIDLKLSDIETIRDDIKLNEDGINDLSQFRDQFITMNDGEYMFKQDDDHLISKDVKTISAELKTGTNYDDEEDRLMSKSEIDTAIDGYLETRQKDLIAFTQTAADGTVSDLSDDDKPVKYTQKKDTEFTQTATRALDAANAKVVTVAGDSVVSLMVGKDNDAADGTPGPDNDDKKLVSKKYVDDKTAASNTETIIKNKGKVSDYMDAIAKAEAENRFVRFWHNIPGVKAWKEAKTISGFATNAKMSSDGQHILVSTSTGDVYMSNDKGTSWTTPVSTGSNVLALAMSPDGKYMVASGADQKVHMSTDSGATWSIKFASPIAGGTVYAIGVSDDGKYIAFGSGAHIYVSSDGGTNWDDITGPAANKFISIFSISVSSNGKDMVVADTSKGIYTSNDNGQTWVLKKALSRANTVRKTAISSDGKYVVAGGDDGRLHISQDHGKAFIYTASTDSTNSAIESLAISGDGKYIVAGTHRNKVWISRTYGSSWGVALNTGGRVQALSISGDGKHIIAGTDAWKVHTSEDFGVSWSNPVTARDSVWGVAVSADGETMVAATSSGDKKIYVSAAAGKHHHALVHEIDKEQKKVYSTEDGKTIEIGNLQLGGTYHLEWEDIKGTTAADGTSTGGATTPTVVTPDIPAPPATTTYTLVFDDGTTQKVKWEETT